MKVSVKVLVLDVDPAQWAANNNGPWPEDNYTALCVAVRHDVKDTVRQVVSNVAMFEELGVKVEVQ